MRIMLSVLLLLLLLPDFDDQPHHRGFGSDPDLRAERVPLFPDAPDRTRLGALTYLGGVRLTSGDRGFGGVSALLLSGNRFTLLSDGGMVVQFRMGSDWRVRDARFGALPGVPGAGYLKEHRDSESLAIDPATGQLWVGFEKYNEIWRYAPGFAAAERRVAPRAMEEWSESLGPEAMTRLADGRFLVISEDLDIGKGKTGRTHPALVFSGDPTIAPNRGFQLRVRPPQGGWRVTEVAELPDGRLLLLVRRVKLATGFVARLLVAERDALHSGGTIAGRTLAEFKAPSLHDNFEAMAVAREGDATIIWIASDDNENLFQQSLLLKFRLDDDAEPTRAD